MPAETEAKSTRGPAHWPAAPPEFASVSLPSRLLIPLSVKTGAAVTPRPPGTEVRRGEPLLENPAESSHVPLASATGKLGDIRPIRLTTGRPVAAVELFPSSDIEPEPDLSVQTSADPLSLIAGLERLRASGVWADRHISPDLIGQLNQIVSRPIDTVICTILDADASLRLGAAVAARMPDRVVAGISFLSRITGARRAIIAVESFAAPLWMAPLASAARAAKIEIVDLANNYPQSDPVLMIYTFTKRRARPGNLPTTHGTLILDAASALAAGDAVSGRPMLTVPIAVHEHVPRRSHFFLVPVGTTVEALLRKLWIEPEDVILRGGDLLRDVRLRPDAVIAGGELAIHVTGLERPVIPEPCIRCAWCIEACPTRVHPALVLDAAQRADPRMANRAGIAACIECGVCEHVCPSRLPLLGAIRSMRNSKAI
jgi:electron transport complex protein RnfC